jgi:hypothetical protein
MEDIFCENCKFFYPGAYPSQGGEEPIYHPCHQCQSPLQQGTEEGAAPPGVEPAPQPHGQRQQQPHLPSVGAEAPEKEGNGTQPPKQQIQRHPQTPPGAPAPQGPKQVVDEAQTHPQRHGAGEGGGLGKERLGHISSAAG